MPRRGGGAQGTSEPTLSDTRRLAKEKATMHEVVALARKARDGAAFARAADGARLARKKKRAQEIFDAEAALEKKLVQQLAAREKELAEAEARARGASEGAGEGRSCRERGEKEVNEARAEEGPGGGDTGAGAED